MLTLKGPWADGTRSWSSSRSRECSFRRLGFQGDTRVVANAEQVARLLDAVREHDAARWNE